MVGLSEKLQVVKVNVKEGDEDLDSMMERLYT